MKYFCISFILISFFVGGVCSSAQADDYKLTEATLSIVGTNVVIDIVDPLVNAKIGHPHRLYQETHNAYIAKVETINGDSFLCAFPKTDKKGRGTAWVTSDKSVLFGMRVISMPSQLKLAESEILTIAGQTDTDWLVILKRYGDEIIIPIAKKMPGIKYIKPQKIYIKKRPSQQQIIEEELQKLQEEDVVQKEDTESGGLVNRWKSLLNKPSAKKDKKVEPRRIKITMGQDSELTAELVDEKIDRVENQDTVSHVVEDDIPTTAETSVKSAEVDDAPAEKAEAIDKKSPPKDKKTSTGQLSTLISRIIIIIAGLGLLAAITVKIVQKRNNKRFKLPILGEKKEKTPPKEEKKQEEEQPDIVEEDVLPSLEEEALPKKENELSDASIHFKTLQNENVDFSGSLASFSILDLIQFLNSSTETGDLTIRDEEEGMTAELFFDKGEIVDAQHGDARGVAAIFGLVNHSKGNFVFFRKPECTAERTIEMPTMSLLLEASKNLDETHPPAVPPAVSTEPTPPPKPLSLKKKE